MTIGEKIQYYRKKLKLSQDELGAKLFVSRQTVSLWETEQTLPTIDNLIRLKEIFGISLDELLCGEDEAATEDDVAERYEFTFTQAEFQENSMSGMGNVVGLFVSMILCAVGVILTLVPWALRVGDSLFSFVCGFCLALFFLYLISYLGVKQMNKKNKSRLLQNVYRYEVHENFLIVRVWRENEVVNMNKILFADLEQVQDNGNFFTYQYQGQLYLIRKSDLRSNSILYEALHGKLPKNKNQHLHGKWRVVSIALCVACVLSLYAALICVATMSGGGENMPRNMWVFFCFLPVPISSIVVGLVLRAKQKKWKKNVVFGVIFTLLLFLYGCFTFLVPNSEPSAHIAYPAAELVQTIDFSQA